VHFVLRDVITLFCLEQSHCAPVLYKCKWFDFARDQGRGISLITFLSYDLIHSIPREVGGCHFRFKGKGCEVVHRRAREVSMRKLMVVTVCVFLSFVVVLNTTGCGCGSEERVRETGTGGKVEVPDVTGLSIDEAGEILEESDLDCGTREEKVTSREEEGKVLSQDPEPGTMLTPDMTVYITVGKF